MNLPKKIISTEVPAVAPAFLGTQPFTTAAKKLLDDFVYLDDWPILFFFPPAVFFVIVFVTRHQKGECLQV